MPKSDVPVNNLLSDRFLVPPFSILDSRLGYWAKRKNDWKKLGLKSELGRGDYIIDEGGNFKENKDFKGNVIHNSFGEKYGRKDMSQTSIFDPVLCEIVYRWFLPNDTNHNKIIDTFAGGSVRGVVASCLNKSYTGIDLRKEQIYANNLQFNEFLQNNDVNITFRPNWICGDSLDLDNLIKDEKFDLFFTCPPYFDLELYSDDPNDLSNQGSYNEFLTIYTNIISKAYNKLNDDSFAVIVVGEIRDKSGNYYNFVGDTIKAFMNCGFNYYNEAILITPIGTLPLRVGKQFNSGRKVGKSHQNVLVFYKGNTKTIKDKFGEVVSETFEEIF